MFFPTRKTVSGFWRYLAGVLAVASATGCSSLYIHDAAVQKSTASASAEFDKLKLDGVFNNESQYLANLEKEELGAVRSQGAAQRDSEILLFLRGNEKVDGRTICALRIDGYLRTLVGKSDRVSPTKLWRIVDDAYADPTQDPAMLLDQDLKTFLPQINDAEGATLPSPSGLTLPGALATLKKDESALQAAEAEGKNAEKDFKNTLEQATKALMPDGSAQKALSDIVNKANAGLTDANPFVRSLISQNLASKIQSLIDATGPSTTSGGNTLSQEAKAGLGFMQAVLGVGDAFSNPPIIPHPNALSATQAWLQYVQDDSNLTIAELKSQLDVDKARVSAVATQVYFLSRAGEEYHKAPQTGLSGGKGFANFLSPAKGPTYAVAASLVYYAEAWNRGFTREMEIDREESSHDATSQA